MNDKIIVLSDIHGNLTALDSVVWDIEKRSYSPDAIVILGDNINYGMRPNKVVKRLMSLSERYSVIVNLFGNHEKALTDGDTTHFSTERGKRVLDYTRGNLTDESLRYVDNLTKEGYKVAQAGDRKILFIHGSLEDPYWGKLNAGTIEDIRYAEYDFVVSGHSHIPHLIEYFYPADNPEYRNKKRTLFLNPGSVGQPRNHNPRAQYLYMEISSETFHFNSVPYDIGKELSLFTDEVDRFYSDRLINGI
ncbi:MAG: metallophosphoesterase family protein [Muribaculaceae bacterium]|nr:metallophosphoesterase family protein [Muribaculaceae bacterium]